MRKLLYSTALGVAVLFSSIANAQQAAGVNVQTPPPINKFGCPVQGGSAICAAPGNTGNFVSTGDGSIGVSRIWSRVNLQSAPPSLSACGSSTLTTTSSDTAGQITLAAATTTCTVTFNTVLTSGAPAVFLTQQSGTFVGYVILPTATGFTITWASAPGAVKFNYFVISFGF